MGRLQGKVAVITGAGAGIGRACALLFAREGAKVFAVGRTQSKLDAVVEEIKKAGGTAASASGDLSKPEDCDKIFAKLWDTFGRVDTLINNAGVGYSWAKESPGSMNDTATCSPEKWREVMGINLDSLFYMNRLAIPNMQKNGGGSIVNVASIWGMMGAADAHAYTAAKGAIINYSRSLCVAYAKDKIRANTLCPGWVATGMVESVLHWFEDPKTAAAVCPSARPADPMEIAHVALFLASDEASYCNGAVFVADGGTLAQ